MSTPQEQHITTETFGQHTASELEAMLTDRIADPSHPMRMVGGMRGLDTPGTAMPMVKPDPDIAPAPLSGAAAAREYNALVDAIGGALDEELDALIETCQMLKQANATQRGIFHQAMEAYSGFVADATGAAGLIRERVEVIRTTGPTSRRAA